MQVIPIEENEYLLGVNATESSRINYSEDKEIDSIQFKAGEDLQREGKRKEKLCGRVV